MTSSRFVLPLTCGALAFALVACRDQPVAHYRISKETTAAPPPAMNAHAGMGAAMPGVAATAAAPAAALAWAAPEHWEHRPAAGPRLATYILRAGAATAELAVTSFPGDVGGEVANINRWRGQLQLPPVSAEQMAPTIVRQTTAGLEVAVVDVLGGPADSPVRLLGALVPHGEQTFFFKLTGAPQVIEQEKAAFFSLLQTLHPRKDDDACCNP